MTRIWPISHRAPWHSRCVPAFFTLLIVTLAAEESVAQRHEGDRFGVRGGIWPQKSVEGSLGRRRFWPTTNDSLDARVNEPSVIAPYGEAFALFHLRGNWWVEGALGYSQRREVEVVGVAPSGDSSLLLGRGRIDFFPVFAGFRLLKPLGGTPAGPAVYARAGGSIVFANESPEIIQDSVSFYGIYSSGTEAAFGFAVGAGAEYFIGRRTGVTLDAQYRYAKFQYGRSPKFDLSAFWLGAGLIYRTR